MVFAQYQSLANEGMPMLSDFHRTPSNVPRFDETSALERLLDKAKTISPDAPKSRFSATLFRPSPAWRGLAAALVLLCIALGSYRFGKSQRENTIASPTVPLSEATSQVTGTSSKLLFGNRKLGKLSSNPSSRRELQISRNWMQRRRLRRNDLIYSPLRWQRQSLMRSQRSLVLLSNVTLQRLSSTMRFRPSRLCRMNCVIFAPSANRISSKSLLSKGRLGA